LVAGALLFAAEPLPLEFDDAVPLGDAVAEPDEPLESPSSKQPVDPAATVIAAMKVRNGNVRVGSIVMAGWLLSRTPRRRSTAADDGTGMERSLGTLSIRIASCPIALLRIGRTYHRPQGQESESA
ncbi:MAG: hypothetical protein ACKVQU_24040, partial [Burkholderiales bacterium]